MLAGQIVNWQVLQQKGCGLIRIWRPRQGISLGQATRGGEFHGQAPLGASVWEGIRGEGLLRRGLKRLEYARDAPLKAENPHELSRSLEVKSIIDNAELLLRSSIERRESRPALDFRRGDFPDQDDQNWLVFLAVRKDEEGGG